MVRPPPHCSKALTPTRHHRAPPLNQSDWKVHQPLQLLEAALARTVQSNHLGLSYGELYKIEPHHIDFKANQLDLHGTKTTSRRRTLPMGPEVKQELQARIDAWRAAKRAAKAGDPDPVLFVPG